MKILDEIKDLVEKENRHRFSGVRYSRKHTEDGLLENGFVHHKEGSKKTWVSPKYAGHVFTTTPEGLTHHYHGKKVDSFSHDHNASYYTHNPEHWDDF